MSDGSDREADVCKVADGGIRTGIKNRSRANTYADAHESMFEARVNRGVQRQLSQRQRQTCSLLRSDSKIWQDTDGNTEQEKRFMAADKEPDWIEVARQSIEAHQ